MFDVLIVDIRQILDNCNSHGLLLEEYTKLINFFCSVINGVHVFGNSVNYFCILFSIFVYLLPCFIDERSHNTLSVVRESAIERILMANV